MRTSCPFINRRISTAPYSAILSQYSRPSVSARRGSIIILILAIIVLVAVMAFGLMEYANTQRLNARFLHQNTLMRMAMHAGANAALAGIEDAYVKATDSGQTDLTQSWNTAFKASTTYPTTTSHPDVGGSDPAVNRRTARLALTAGANDPNSGFAYDLWRGQPGLSSPPAISGSAVHAFDDGYTVSDGVGKWFNQAYFDRDMVAIAESTTKSAYILRYAVAIIDQSGLVLGNKARYQHLTSNGTPVHPRLAYTAATTALSTANAVVSSGLPCSVTDISLGANVTDTNMNVGYDKINYNTFRPIPADHSFLGYFLISRGFDVDDNVPSSYQDGYALVNGDDQNSLGFNVPKDGFQQGAVYYKRVPGNLPESLRAQGFWKMSYNYPQWSNRFVDFLPFEMNPWAPMDANPGGAIRDQTKHAAGGKEKLVGVIFSRNSLKYPTDYTSWGQTDTVGWQRISTTNFPSSLYPNATTAFEGIRNQHPTALAALANSDASFPYRNEVILRMWQSLDFINWPGISQSLRIHATQINGTNSYIRPASAADALVQLFTPFGTISGFYDTCRDRQVVEAGSNPGLTITVGSTKTSSAPTDAANMAKNQWEMRTQWAVNINTAPRKVFEGLFKTVVTDLPGSGGTASAETAKTTSGTNDYFDGIKALAAKAESNRNTAAVVPSNMLWSNSALSDSWATAVSGLSGLTRARAMRGLRSLIHGGASGRGPIAEFEVVSITVTGSGTSTVRSIVIKGLHDARFHNIGDTLDGFNQNTEYRISLATGSGLTSEGTVSDVRQLPIVSGTTSSTVAGDKRLFAPFRVKWVKNVGGNVTPNTGANTTTINVNTEAGEGYADADDFAELAKSWDPLSKSVTTVAYIDMTCKRRRDYPDIPWPSGGDITKPDSRHLAWYDYGPGLSLVAGRSRHYRILVRAQLLDVDNPIASRERAWDRVFMIDPDRQGMTAGGNGFMDAVALYNDLENTPTFSLPPGVFTGESISR